jgi:hypothetical protein
MKINNRGEKILSDCDNYSNGDRSANSNNKIGSHLQSNNRAEEFGNSTAQLDARGQGAPAMRSEVERIMC